MDKYGTTYGISDMYQALADKILKDNPDYWSTRDKHLHIRHGFIYAKSKDRVIEIMSYSRFVKVAKIYFLLARKRIIAGHTVNIGSRLGFMQARTVTRNFKNKQINWKETLARPRQLNENGEMRYKKVYYTSDTYSRIKWEKNYAVANRKVYNFKPAGGNGPGKGFKGEFTQALRNDSLLETKYKQFRNGKRVD